MDTRSQLAATLLTAVADPISTIEHPVSCISLREDGILEFRYRDHVYMDLDKARAIISAAQEMVGARAPLPTIVYLGQIRGSSKESREFMAYSDENASLSTRVALIVSSHVGRMLVNLLFGLSPPRIPTRAFNDDRLALAWLGARDADLSPRRRLIEDTESDL